VDQRDAEALFLNSGPAEADYGKNSGCPPLSFSKWKDIASLALLEMLLYNDTFQVPVIMDMTKKSSNFDVLHCKVF
jgi:hypothetical protein